MSDKTVAQKLQIKAKHTVRLVNALRGYDDALWITYPKGISAVKTDINRDIIAASAKTVAWQVVAICSIDVMWSAMRIKRL